MNLGQVLKSSFITSIQRYRRSRGLWLLLLSAPIAGRTLAQGSWVHVTLEGHLPIMTSATLGAVLGIIVATIVWPIGTVYLRSNTTRRQPWQIEELTPASRIAIALGRFAADLAVLWGALAVLSVAGLILGGFLIEGPFEPIAIVTTLWWIAAPTLMLLAAQHILLDALPATRGAFGEVVAFLCWMVVLALPATAFRQTSSFATNMADPAGYVRPLAGHIFAIGGTRVVPGRVNLAVIPRLRDPGYRASRLVWGLVALASVLLAGLLYRPHRAVRQHTGARIARLFPRHRPRFTDLAALPARRAASPLLNLLVAQFHLIASGGLFVPLALVAALLGVIGDFRHIGSPAALLLLAFGLANQAGRAESNGMASVSGTAPLQASARRIAFVGAGIAWGTLLAVPAALTRGSIEPLRLGLVTSSTAAIAAIGLAAVSGSAFTPRIVLLVVWYVYLVG